MSIEDKFLEITQKDLDTMWTKTQESARNFARTYYLTPSGQVVLRSEAFPSKKESKVDESYLRKLPFFGKYF